MSMKRKRLVDFDAELEDDLMASAEDYKAGRVLGPFTTAKEAVTALYKGFASRRNVLRRQKISGPLRCK